MCPAGRKVPPLEHEFLKDQRSLRVMIIGGRDAIESKKLKKRSKRKEKSLQSELNRSIQVTKIPVLRHESSVIENDSVSPSSSDDNTELYLIFISINIK